LTGDFHFLQVFISRILSPDVTSGDSNLSSPAITQRVKRFFPRFHSGLVLSLPKDTILHTRKYFAVSPELNRFVTVRNSILTDDGRYPLRLSRPRVGAVCSDFPLRPYVGVAIQYLPIYSITLAFLFQV